MGTAGQASGACPAWILWVLLTALGLVLAVSSAKRYPYADDWLVLPYALGEKGLSLSWLWEPYNGHRIPYVKAVHVLILRATDLSYPSVAAFGVLMLSAGTAALLSAMRRWPLTSALASPLVVLMVLSPLLPAWRWSFMSNYAGVLTAVCLLLASRWVDQPGALRWTDWLLTLLGCALLLTNGIAGLIFLSILVSGAFVRSVRRHTDVLPAAVLTAIVLCVVVVSLWHSDENLGAHGGATLSSTSTALVSLITLGLSPLAAPLPMVLQSATAVATGTCMVFAWRRSTGPLVPALILTFLAATAVSLSIAVGRSGTGWAPEFARFYSLLTVPFGLSVLLTIEVARPLWLRKAEVFFVVLLTTATVVGTASAISIGNEVRRAADAINSKMVSGVDAEQIARDHLDQLALGQTAASRATVEKGIRLLRDRGKSEL